jgi:lysophospholipase L1-like esterase
MKALALFVTILVFSSLSFAQTPATIFLAGDSTMAPKLVERRPETGWGEKLQEHFKDGKVVVDNRALNGRSTKSFIAEGKWTALIDAVKKGDFVFIQFGHNDQAKDKGERYTPPDDFNRNLVKFVDEVRSKGANPVLMTPVMRRRFDKDGKFYDTHGDYPGYTRVVAAENKVPLIDMQRKSEAVIVRYGVEGSKKLFLQLAPGENANYPKGVEDNTHFSPLGAEEMAKLAVEGIMETKLKLSKYLKK